jgi:hypothetical protein
MESEQGIFPRENLIPDSKLHLIRELMDMPVSAHATPHKPAKKENMWVRAKEAVQRLPPGSAAVSAALYRRS